MGPDKVRHCPDISKHPESQDDHNWHAKKEFGVANIPEIDDIVLRIYDIECDWKIQISENLQTFVNIYNAVQDNVKIEIVKLTCNNGYFDNRP